MAGLCTPLPTLRRRPCGRLRTNALARARAGQWLIPAFHAVIDGDIRGGHDDPQNFDLESFAHSLEKLLDRLSSTGEPSILLVLGTD
jgi:hypothetical protein